MPIIVEDVNRWLKALAQDDFPEDRVYEGKSDQAVSHVMLCWFPNRAARLAAIERGADLIVMHEVHFFEVLNHDPGCPPVADWKVTREVRDYFDSHRVALLRSHRALDSYCIPRDFARALGLPEPTIHAGHNGYEFTLVYDIDPISFGVLAARLKKKIGLPMVRVSAGKMDAKVTRLGSGWGGVSASPNLQYMELLRCHGVEVVIGGEVDEYAAEYFRDSGMRWIELGHYESEIIGIERVAHDMQAAFPGLAVSCFTDEPRSTFV